MGSQLACSPTTSDFQEGITDVNRGGGVAEYNDKSVLSMGGQFF
jgi:hypothetical protein